MPSCSWPPITRCCAIAKAHEMSEPVAAQSCLHVMIIVYQIPGKPVYTCQPSKCCSSNKLKCHACSCSVPSSGCSMLGSGIRLLGFHDTHPSFSSVRRSRARWHWRRGCACGYWTMVRAQKSEPGHCCAKFAPCRYLSPHREKREDTSFSTRA